jgi:hypothetical protein
LSDEAIESFGHGKALDDGFGDAGFESAYFEAKRSNGSYSFEPFGVDRDLVDGFDIGSSQQTNEMPRAAVVWSESEHFDYPTASHDDFEGDHVFRCTCW